MAPLLVLLTLQASQVGAARPADVQLLCHPDAKGVVPAGFTGREEEVGYHLDLDGRVQLSPGAGFEVTTRGSETKVLARVDVVEADGSHVAACGWIDVGEGYELPDLERVPGAKLELRVFTPTSGVIKKTFDRVSKPRTEALTKSVAAHELEALRRIVLEAVQFEVTFDVARALAALARGEARVTLLKNNLGCGSGATLHAVTVKLCGGAERIGTELAVARARLRAGDKLPADYVSLVKDPPKKSAKALAAEKKSRCRDVARLRWLTAAGDLYRKRLFAKLPGVPTKRVLSIAYAAGKYEATRDVRDLDALVVTAVPRGIAPSFDIRSGSRVRDGAAATLARFLAVFPTLARGSSVTLPTLQGCKDTSYMAPYRDDSLVIDEDTPPIAEWWTTTHRLVALKDDRQSIISVCASKACAPDAKGRKERNQIEVTPLPYGSVTLLVEAAVNAGDLREPSFRRLGGPAGPDQLFRLENHFEPTSLVSTSLLLGMLLGRWVVAIGPSLLIGTSGGTFDQWSLRVGRRLGDGVYFTFGLGLRFVDAPGAGHRIGEIRALPRGDGVTSPPPLETQTDVELVVPFGLAIDLSVISDGGKALLEKLGVK